MSNQATKKKKLSKIDILIQEVAKILELFFWKSMNFENDGCSLNFYKKLEFVEARTVSFRVDNIVEQLLIRRTDGKVFEPVFVQAFEPTLIQLVNTIIEANNHYVMMTGNTPPLIEMDVRNFMKLNLSPFVSDDNGDNGGLYTGRMEIDEDEIDDDENDENDDTFITENGIQHGYLEMVRESGVCLVSGYQDTWNYKEVPEPSLEPIEKVDELLELVHENTVASYQVSEALEVIHEFYKSILENDLIEYDSFYASSYICPRFLASCLFFNESECLLVIHKTSRIPMTEEFLDRLRPCLVKDVNEIIQASNDYCVATNYHVQPLYPQMIQQFLHPFIKVSVPTYYEKEQADGHAVFEKKDFKISMGIRVSLESNYYSCDYTKKCTEEEKYKNLPRGDAVLLELLV